MKKSMMVALLALSGTVFAADSYHVYKLQNGECEIDTRSPERYKSDRGGVEVGKFSSRTDAQNERSKQVKAGACKCPSGQNC